MSTRHGGGDGLETAAVGRRQKDEDDDDGSTPQNDVDLTPRTWRAAQRSKLF